MPTMLNRITVECRAWLAPSCEAGRGLALMAVLALGGLTGCQADQSGGLFADVLEPFVAPTPTEAALDAFSPFDPDRRRRAVALLSAAPFGGEEPYMRTYRLLATTDRDATVRAVSVKALGEHGGPAEAPLIIPMLGDVDPFVRWQAARALQKIHDPAAVEPLIRTATTDEDPDARMAAAYALGQYPTPGVYDALVAALADPDFGVAHNAQIALQTLTGKQFPPDPDAWMAWSNENRQQLFADQQPYGYLPYVDPPNWFDRTILRRKSPVPSPVTPEGLQASAQP